jgi:hypothetical protein
MVTAKMTAKAEYFGLHTKHLNLKLYTHIYVQILKTFFAFWTTLKPILNISNPVVSSTDGLPPQLPR